MPRDPIREWREEYARRWLSIDFAPMAGASFHASVKPLLDEPRIARVSLSPSLSFRDEGLVKDGDDSFSLIFSLTRNTEVAHCGRELRLGRGDATVLHVCETGTVGSREKFGYLHVPMRSSEIEARGARLDSAVMKPLSRHSESVPLPVYP